LFLVVISAIRDLAPDRMPLPDGRPLQRTAPTAGIRMMLSSVLSTVFDLAFAILPAAPLFAAKKLSSSADPGPEQPQEKRSAKSA
jgi:hypothetical protein